VDLDLLALACELDGVAAGIGMRGRRRNGGKG
jgi:hypothetical protein